MLLFLIIYFLIKIGFMASFIGGPNVYARTHNVGLDYNLHYIHLSEVKSMEFFILNSPFKSNLYLDRYANLRALVSGINYRLDINIFQDPYPSYISRNSYVYSDYSNNFNKLSVTKHNRVPLIFTFPTEFLNDNKNKIYANGGSEIFK